MAAALTATLRADITDFERAIAQADTKITGLQRSTAQINRELAKFGNDFGGANLIRQANSMAKAVEDIGGVTRLTATEQKRLASTVDEALEKYRALGVEVPPALVKISSELHRIDAAQEEARKSAQELAEIQKRAAAEQAFAFERTGGMAGALKGVLATVGGAVAGAFTVGAVVNFAKEIVDLGGQITDLSQRTGLSVEAVQEFKFAADQTGSSIETFSGAVTKLSDKLVQGDKGTVKAVKDLGLSFAELRQLSPEDAFTRVADAVGRIPDPMKQTQVALDLFGKAGAEILPAIKNGFSDLRDQARELGQVLSEEDVAALDEFGDRFGTLMTSLQVAAAQAGLAIADSLTSGWDQFLAAVDAGLRRGAGGFGAGFIAEAMRQRIVGDVGGVEGQIARAGRMDAAMGLGPGAGGPVLSEAELARLAAAEQKYAEALRDRIDVATGADVRAEIKQIADAYAALSTAQRNNATVVQKLLKPYEELRQETNVLPIALEKARKAVQQPIASRNLFETTRTEIVKVGDSVKQLDRTFASIVPLPKAIKAEEAKNNLIGLRKDGLLPVSASFMQVIPQAASLGDAIDTSAVKSKNLSAELNKLSQKELKALQREAERAREEMNRLGESIGDSISAALEAGIATGDWKEAISNLSKDLGQQVGEEAGKAVSANLGGGFGAGLAGSLVSFGTGLVLSKAFEVISGYITQEADEAAARLQADALRNQLRGQFGGSQRNMDEALERAGVSPRSRNVINNVGDPEQVARSWVFAEEALQSYQAELAALDTVISGTIRVSKGLGQSLQDSMDAQTKPILEAQQAQIEAMKKAGKSAEEISAQQAKFAEENAKRVFTANQQQIESYNNLGLAIGGAIANAAGRTGDLVSAVLQAKPAIDELLQARKDFGLGEQTSAATAEMLHLFETVNDNSHIFEQVTGWGEILSGFSGAMVNNIDLVNAAGHELSALTDELHSRGVSVEEIYALLSPQLQELWEVVEDGKLVVDETTQALLDQAEKQGVVGNSMREVNEQILMVLTEIRDLFMDDLPTAIERTTQATQRGSAQQRAALEGVGDAANDVGQAHEEAQRRTRGAIEKTSQFSEEQLRDMTEDVRRAADKEIGHHRRVTDDVKQQHAALAQWLSQHPLESDWVIESPELPDPEAYVIPVEFELPDGFMPWDEQPRFPRATAASSSSAASSDRRAMAIGPRAVVAQPAHVATIDAPVVSVDLSGLTFVGTMEGQPVLRYVAKNLPRVIETRTGQPTMAA